MFGCLISFILGGCVGLLIGGCLAAAREEPEDGVDVVRCKECRHRNKGHATPGGHHICDFHSCDREGHERYLFVEDIDFCSCGERRPAKDD